MQNIFRDGILVDVSVSYWTGAITLTAADLGLDPSKVTEAFHLGKKFLVPMSVIRRFRTKEGQARKIVTESSFPFPIGHARFVPRRKFTKVLDKLTRCQKDYDDLVNDLIEKYQDYREKMIPLYEQAAETAYATQTQTGDDPGAKGKFVKNFLKHIDSLYPAVETLRNRFSMTWDVYEIAMPNMKLSDAEKIALSQEEKDKAEAQAENERQYYQDKVHQKMDAFINEVVTSLRGQAVSICSRITKNIQDGKIVTGKTLKTLREFIDKFSELNFVGDTRMEQELTKLRKEFLDKNTTAAIHDEDDLKTELNRRLTLLVEMANNITDVNSVTGEYQRKISWHEDIPADLPAAA